MPPPPPGGAGGSGPGDSRSEPYSIGNAFNYGWTKFQANIGPIILAALAIFVLVAVIQFIGALISGGLAGAGSSDLTYDPNTGEWSGGADGAFFGASLFVSLLFGLISMVVSLIIQVGIIRASLSITYGREVTVSQVFSTDNIVQVIIAALIIGVAATVGFVLCIIPGIIVVFFTAYSFYFIVDKDMPALEGIKSSISFVNKNLGTLIGFFLASLLAYFVGALLCLVGLLAAIPVVLIAQAYTYRKLQGEEVAA